MDYRIILLLFSFVVFMGYYLYVFFTIGPLESISDSYYHIKDHTGAEWPFSVAMSLTAIPIMVVGVEINALYFLSPAALIFVAFAPEFKSRRLEEKVHRWASILSVFFSIVGGIFITSSLLMSLIIVAEIGCIIYFLYDGSRFTAIRDAELSAYIGTFLILLIHLL